MNSNQQNIMIDEYLKAFAEPSTHLGVKKTIPMQYAGKDYLFVVQEVLVTDAIKDMLHEVFCYSVVVERDKIRTCVVPSWYVYGHRKS